MTTPARTGQPVPCGLGRRLLIIVYDTLIVLALLMLAAAVALPVTGGAQQAFRDVPYTLYLAAVWFAYLGWCWTRGGQTVGMRAWKVRLRTGRETLPGWHAVGIRFAVSLVSALCLGAGFWLSLFRPDRACWHDRASGTRLVRVDPDSSRTAQDDDDGDSQ